MGPLNPRDFSRTIETLFEIAISTHGADPGGLASKAL